MMDDLSTTSSPMILVRNAACELIADEGTKRTFGRAYGQYLFDECDGEGPQTVVMAAGRDLGRELNRRVLQSGRSNASCWTELMREDAMREWYRLAKLRPARDSDRRFAHIVRFQNLAA